MFRMYKAAAVLLALMKLYTIPCHDRGHINPLNAELNSICHLLALLGVHHFLHVSRIRVNVMLVLQCCSDPLLILPDSSSATYATSCDVGNVKVEEDVNVKQEDFKAVNEEVYIDIKQEEIPEDINFQDITSEPLPVSCVYMCVIRHILPMSRNICCVCDISSSGQLKKLNCWE